MNTTLKFTEEQKALIDRAIAIQDEYKANPKPAMSYTSSEDCDDAYQARLEWYWWRDELKEEFDNINKQLGITGKKLF